MLTLYSIVTMHRPRILRTALTAFALLVFSASVSPVSTLRAQQNFDAVQIEAIPVAGNIYMLTGSGGNIGVIVGDDGTFLVDDQYAPLTDKITATIATLTDQPVKYVINTHWHGDHTGGNENLGKAGALIVAHDNVRERMSTDQFLEAFDMSVPASPDIALPVITFAEDVSFHLNGEHIHAFHVSNAHTDGDTIIHFKEANVFHMGDTFFSGRFPFIDLGSGGSIDGMITAANRVLSLSDDNTRIIPGHGPLSTPDDLKEYRGMLTRLRSTIARMVSEGNTLEEVQAATPADGYEEWSSDFISSERIVETIYADLSGNN